MGKGRRALRNGRPAGSWALVGLLCGGGLWASCAGPIGGPSPAQESIDAVHAFESARMVHMEGQVKQVALAYGVNLSMDGDDVDGTVVVQDVPVLVQRVGGKLFFRSNQYFEPQGLVTSTRWVLAPNDNLAGVVHKLIDRSDLAKALLAVGGGNVERKDGPVIQGQKTDELVGSALNVFVPTSGRQRPLRIQTASGHELRNQLRDVELDLSYGRPAHVEVPSKYVDPSDRNTLPVRFVVVPDTFDFESCDTRGCSLSTQVRNAGGRDGLATATFRVRQNGKEVASCIADIAVVGSGEATKVGCRTNYDRRLETSANVTINNLLP